MIKGYLKSILEIYKKGDAREESYYSALADFIKSLGEKFNKKISVTILPKKTEAGNPDFRIWDGKQKITGYIEAKTPGTNLDVIERSEQLKRYLGTFPNVILTNFHEFRLYRNGEMIYNVILARYRTLFELHNTLIENEDKFLSMMEKFFDFSLPKIYSPKALAMELAKRTRFLKNEIVKNEIKSNTNLQGFYTAFKEYLIKDLTENDFIDLFSQTITYGLFAARTKSDESFTREHAYEKIPKSIGILKDIFKYISIEEIPDTMRVLIDDITEVLSVTDVSKILDKFYKDGKGSDPVVHFYETFLNEYDPETREKRGVYYTPQPVVSFIVRSLNTILKEKFKKSDGFADSTVTVLDPAAGTLTFIAEATKIAVEEYKSKYGAGNLKNFIKEHFLDDIKTEPIEGNFFAFELMMSPYAIGHIKMSFLLEELGYQLSENERVNLYLTNTLEMEDKKHPQIPGIISSLSEEDKKAHKIKQEKPILIIMGNPPYSGISSNNGEWITSLLKENKDGVQSYYEVDGESLGERNPKWLQDDYVKFIRFSQWKIQQNGEGILGFITNHSYLDNPTFRGMRQSLMKTFDEIYILDLHGNSLKKEVCPDLPAPRQDLFWVYVLKCKDESFYIGQTNNIQRRIKELEQKEESWTKSRLPVKIIHLEKFKSREEAVKRETELKTGFGRKWLKREYKKGTLKPWQVGGSKDENVFDIMQGVSIALFIKNKGKKGESKVYHSELWGLRNDKYDFLLNNDLKTIEWKELNPNSPFYFFIPQNTELEEVYNKFSRINKIFPVNSVGVVTSRDNFVISDDENELKRRYKMLIDENISDEIILKTFNLKENKRWKLKEIRKTLKKENKKLKVEKILYRPFDKKYILYNENLIERSRKEVMKHMLKENLGLITVRQVAEGIFNHVYLSNNIIESRITLSNKGIAYLFPLFLYDDNDIINKKKPNFNFNIYNKIKETFQKEITPEEIFYYIYGVMYSNIYREKYKEFLKYDFPRIPFTKNYDLFIEIGKLGKELADLHLLKSERLNNPISKFPIEGTNLVEKVKYNEDKKRIYINKAQYFDGIEPDVHEYMIGGYQVSEKWLKSRKGKYLTTEEIKIYCRIITALSHTIKLQKQLDNLYPEVEKDLIEFEEGI